MRGLSEARAKLFDWVSTIYTYGREGCSEDCMITMVAFVFQNMGVSAIEGSRPQMTDEARDAPFGADYDQRDCSQCMDFP